MSGIRAWIEVTACADKDLEDWSVWHDAFEEFGPTGSVERSDPPGLSAYLPPGAYAQIGPLTERLLGLGAVEVRLRAVPEEDWSASWRQFFVPRRIGNRFLIVPSWEVASSQDGDIVIDLDPGQAFGTGDHPTTRMCLELLEPDVHPGMTVLDLGCGSGILAIGAAKLGGTVTAIDIDPVAVEAAAANCVANGVPITVRQGALPEGGPYDLVVSNIISAAIIGLAPAVARVLKTGGTWLVSGIIAANWPLVAEAVEAAGLRVGEIRQEDDWIASRLHS